MANNIQVKDITNQHVIMKVVIPPPLAELARGRESAQPHEHPHYNAPVEKREHPVAANVAADIVKNVIREFEHRLEKEEHPHRHHEEHHHHGGGPPPSQQVAPIERIEKRVERASEKEIGHPHHHHETGQYAPSPPPIVPPPHPHHGHPHGTRPKLRDALLKATACRLCNGDRIEDLEAIEFTTALNEQVLAEKTGHHNIGIAQ
jgi:hypothetical protein